ncbi:MAG: four-carbon acid sugar kinase family protein [Acidobacteriota bacterium]
MYTVIADDLTGAAEIGGVALRYGLKAEVHIGHPGVGTAEVRVIDTDTRSRHPRKATRRLAELARTLAAEATPGIFKKVDSVLRGPILAELRALLPALGRPRALVVPSSPSRGRIITGGKYRIKGRLIHHTDFQKDPEYPIRSPDVVKMLQPWEGAPTPRVLTLEAKWPETGIFIGEASSRQEMLAWAGKLDEKTLPAGSAEFFAAVLQQRHPCHLRELKPPRDSCPAGNLFLVSGSASLQSRQSIEDFERTGIPVLPMPLPLFKGTENPKQWLRQWARAVEQAFQTCRCVVVHIGQPVATDRERATAPSRYLAQVWGTVLGDCPVAHLCIEGGSTASRLVRHLGWSQFQVYAEIEPGILCLRRPGEPSPLLTLKPGSYPWPAAFLATPQRGMGY